MAARSSCMSCNRRFARITTSRSYGRSPSLDVARSRRFPQLPDRPRPEAAPRPAGEPHPRFDVDSMKLRIVALGHRLPSWVGEAYSDYARRMPRGMDQELVEIKAEPRDRGKNTEQMLAAEAERIAASTKGFLIVALDERGLAW